MDDHSRTIIHIDIDCFYAQVEMIKNPALSQKPLGIQQKNIVVTSNYVAREFGVQKCMLVSETKKLCPQIVLVNGEDLHDYRQVSYKVTELLQSYSQLIERLGLDENFVDVSHLVNSFKIENRKPVGFHFGSDDILCDCGCTERICIGTCIAQEIRTKIFTELKLTTCAGVAHNKLLAKIVGSKNKPNKQSYVFPNSASELILSLKVVQKVPSIGASTAEHLKQIGIESTQDLQNTSTQQLQNLVGKEKAEHLVNLSFGVDNTPVKKTGKPQTIGLEDSCKPIKAEKETQEKLQQLLQRLLILVEEDGRIPKTVKLTIRKLDTSHPQNGTRESRQCHINTSLFISKNSRQRNEKLIYVIMMLFKRVVNTKQKFHITLLGLAFTKFVERPNVNNTLTNFFSKDLEVQTFTSIENEFGRPKTPREQLPESSLSPEIPSKRFKCSKQEINKNQDLEDKEIMCPKDVDKQVFKALPRDLQEELWNDYKRRNEVRKSSGKYKSNSILNYFTKKPKLDTIGSINFT